MDGAVVDKGGGTRFALADVNVGVREFVFFEPLDNVITRSWPGVMREPFEHVLGTA